MKKATFIALFVSAHVILIFLQIHKHSQRIRLSYQTQKNEAEKELLVQKKQDLTQQVYALKNRSAIKKFALNKLNMSKIQLKQINKLGRNE